MRFDVLLTAGDVEYVPSKSLVGPGTGIGTALRVPVKMSRLERSEKSG